MSISFEFNIEVGEDEGTYDPAEVNDHKEEVIEKAIDETTEEDHVFDEDSLFGDINDLEETGSEDDSEISSETKIDDHDENNNDQNNVRDGSVSDDEHHRGEKNIDVATKVCDSPVPKRKIREKVASNRTPGH